MTTDKPTPDLDVHAIMKLIPHRYPFLLIDKVIEIKHGKSAVGIKNVTINEPHFTGHFPEKAIMPGVLIIEAMAQTSGVLVCDSIGADAENHMVYFMSIDSAKFRKPVVPGDTLRILVEADKNRGNIWRFASTATVDGVKVAEAVYSAMIVKKEA